MATKTADLHIRIRPGLKRLAEEYFDKAGLTMSQAVEQFLAWTVKHQRMPMRRRANIPDLSLMTNEEVQEMLEEAEKEVEEGKFITMEQLKENMEKRYGFKSKY